MKRINTQLKFVFSLMLILMALTGFSQGFPKQINYQGIARTPNSASVIANTAIGIKFDILNSSSTVPIFTETKTVTSNALGLFNTQIGSPTGTLDLIPWATGGPYSLQVSLQLPSTSSPTLAGTPQQFNAVPFAFATPILPLNYDPVTGVLSLGSQQKTLTFPIPGLLVAGNTLSITGGNSVALPTPTINGSGATSVTAGPNNVYNINTPSVTVNPLLNPLIPGSVLGLAQVIGTYPNYSVVVAPDISYSQSTGSLVVKNNTLIPQLATPGYTYNYDITPILSLQNGTLLTSGPPTNTVDITSVSPWRWNQATNQVTLAASPTLTQAVGINTASPVCALDVNGFTKLGASAPQIQMLKVTGTYTNALPSSQQIPFPIAIAQDKIIGVSVMIDSGLGPGSIPDWIPAGYSTISGIGNLDYTWRITNNGIVIVPSASNSSSIFMKAIRVLITYEQ